MRNMTGDHSTCLNFLKKFLAHSFYLLTQMSHPPSFVMPSFYSSLPISLPLQQGCKIVFVAVIAELSHKLKHLTGFHIENRMVSLHVASIGIDVLMSIRESLLYDGAHWSGLWPCWSYRPSMSELSTCREVQSLNPAGRCGAHRCPYTSWPLSQTHIWTMWSVPLTRAAL